MLYVMSVYWSPTCAVEHTSAVHIHTMPIVVAIYVHVPSMQLGILMRVLGQGYHNALRTLMVVLHVLTVYIAYRRHGCQY